MVRCSRLQLLRHIARRVEQDPENAIFSVLMCWQVLLLDQKSVLISASEETTHCHDEEHVGCSFRIFALKAAELRSNTDKIMALMTKPLALHSKS